MPGFLLRDRLVILPLVPAQLPDKRNGGLLHSGVVRQSLCQSGHGLGQLLRAAFSLKLDVLDGLFDPRMAQAVILLERIALVHKIGVNINQIARSVNAGIAKADDARRGLYLLDQVYELMYQVAKK